MIHLEHIYKPNKQEKSHENTDTGSQTTDS